MSSSPCTQPLSSCYGPSASFYLLLLLNPNSFIVLFHSINSNSTHDDDRETLGRQPLKDDHSQTKRPAGDDPPAGRPLSDREDLREMTPSRTTTFQTEGPVGDDPLTGRPPSDGETRRSRPTRGTTTLRPGGPTRDDPLEDDHLPNRRTGGRRPPHWTTTFTPEKDRRETMPLLTTFCPTANIEKLAVFILSLTSFILSHIHAHRRDPSRHADFDGVFCR
ncbi:hypothetical protein R3P38DRAFT_3212990 [Favolaschia claudopus]|uniref:Uncharacterized protein n=1 Tax=Favolaschia claudopus TaxID=2862362 RepID=A0AAW0AE87_9AGAR